LAIRNAAYPVPVAVFSASTVPMVALMVSLSSSPE
jgi:hypothetical protein